MRHLMLLYIETLDASDPIRTFYEDYLVGNDLQARITDEIAKEMNYTVNDGAVHKTAPFFIAEKL